MNRTIALVLLLGLAQPSIAAPPLPPGNPLSRLRLLPPVLLEGEQGFPLEERMAHFKVEGVAVAVVKDSRILWEASAGLADRELGTPASVTTLFQAGSISKPVAAAGVLRQVEDGKLALAVDANAYLKSWKVPQNEWTRKRPVSLELLLSHRAGLTVHGFPGYAAGEPVPTVPQILDGAAPANTEAVRVDVEPGTEWRYSGGGYTVAQLVMVDRFGKPFPDLMRKLVLEPAGMSSSTYQQPLPPDRLERAAAGYHTDGSPVAGKRHTYPEMAAAGLWTTAGDLARFGIAIQRSLAGERRALLRKDTALLMVTPAGKAGDSPEAFGLGFAVEKHGEALYFGHGGADEGFQALLLMSRDGGHGVAVMTNSDSGIRLAQEIVRGVARDQGWPGYLPAPLATLTLPPERLALLSGRYQTHGDEAFTVEARGARLFGRLALADEFELFPIAGNVFVRKDRDTRYQLEIAAGAPSAITLVTGDEELGARRMPEGTMLPFDHLAAGRLDEAAAAYRALFAVSPGDRGVAEPRLNDLGYTLAGRKEYDRAIAVLKLATELYPASANAQDSLGEVYGLAGDQERSLACYRKVLELLPADPRASPSLKKRLRAMAEARLAKAAGSAGAAR